MNRRRVRYSVASTRRTTTSRSKFCSALVLAGAGLGLGIVTAISRAIFKLDKGRRGTVLGREWHQGQPLQPAPLFMIEVSQSIAGLALVATIERDELLCGELGVPAKLKRLRWLAARKRRNHFCGGDWSSIQLFGSPGLSKSEATCAQSRI
jgi:hypothetical protein